MEQENVELNVMTPSTKRKEYQERVLKALKYMKDTGASIRNAAAIHGIPKSNLGRALHMHPVRIGEIGRPPLLTRDQELVFMHQIAHLGSEGEWTSVETLGAKAFVVASESNCISSATMVPSKTYFYKVRDRHPDVDIRQSSVKEKNKLNIKNKTIETCRSYFMDMRDTFSALDYGSIRADCSASVAAIPSIALFAADEVGCTCYHDGKQYGITIGKMPLQGNTSGNISFHITLMLTICLAGYSIPNFYIISDECELAKQHGSLFVGIPDNVRLSTNGSGSMEISKSPILGTFDQYCDHLIKYMHNFSRLDKRLHQVVIYVDNHASHFDLDALTKLRANNIMMKTIPSQSTDMYQVGDSVHINKKIQQRRREEFSKLRQLGISLTVEISISVIQQVTSQITKSDILKAAEVVGFVYTDQYARLVMSDEDVNQNLKRFQSRFVYSKENEKELYEKKRKILDDVQNLQTNGIIPSDISPCVADPAFIVALQGLSSASKMESGIRNLNSRRSPSATIASGIRTLTGDEFMSIQKLHAEAQK